MVNGITSVQMATWIIANIVTVTGLTQMVHGILLTVAVHGKRILLAGGLKTVAGIHIMSGCGLMVLITTSMEVDTAQIHK